jgi:hypothetical protein
VRYLDFAEIIVLYGQVTLALLGIVVVVAVERDGVADVPA